MSSSGTKAVAEHYLITSSTKAFSNEVPSPRHQYFKTIEGTGGRGITDYISTDSISSHEHIGLKRHMVHIESETQRTPCRNNQLGMNCIWPHEHMSPNDPTNIPLIIMTIMIIIIFIEIITTMTSSS